LRSPEGFVGISADSAVGAMLRLCAAAPRSLGGGAGPNMSSGRGSGLDEISGMLMTRLLGFSAVPG
jgi:hypothetical protein